MLQQRKPICPISEYDRHETILNYRFVYNPHEYVYSGDWALAQCWRRKSEPLASEVELEIFFSTFCVIVFAGLQLGFLFALIKLPIFMSSVSFAVAVCDCMFPLYAGGVRFADYDNCPVFQGRSHKTFVNYTVVHFVSSLYFQRLQLSYVGQTNFHHKFFLG